jgi:predicted transcriptional regulator
MESKTRSTSMPPGMRRNDIDIMANILSAANRSTKKTHIMYKCCLSYKQLQLYLQLLLNMEFLTTNQMEDSQKFDSFKTTSKGFKFLEAYRTLKSLMT